MKYAATLAFLACIPIANWLIGNVGTKCVPNGPCLIPVGFGLMTPSGVLMISVALVLRDVVQRVAGTQWALAAIVAGSVMSAAVAPPALVIASATAFLVSELIDMAVYTPLQRRGLVLAVLASNGVGLIVDSVLFLTIAFGSLDYIAGQIVGKAWATLAAVAVIAAMQPREVVA